VEKEKKISEDFKVIPVGEDIKPPKLLKPAKIKYPEKAKAKGIEGMVILAVTTDTYGRVHEVKVLRSVPELDEAAVETVRKLVYEPFVLDGEPVGLHFSVAVRFLCDAARAVGVVGGKIGGKVGGVVGGIVKGPGELKPGEKISGVVEGQPVQITESGAVRATGAIKPPELIKRVEPEYPEEARKKDLEGVVIIEAETDIYGRVVKTKVLRSIPGLDEAAEKAVIQWVYEPFLFNGKPKGVVFTVTVRFKLRDKR
jgi:TonB family protein